MKTLLSLLFVTVTNFGFTQTSDSTKKIRIGFTISPDYSYRTLRASEQFQFIADLRDKIEIPKLGYTDGVRILFSLKKTIDLELGILYSNKGLKSFITEVLTTEPEPEEIISVSLGKSL